MPTVDYLKKERNLASAVISVAAAMGLLKCDADGTLKSITQLPVQQHDVSFSQIHQAGRRLQVCRMMKVSSGLK